MILFEIRASGCDPSRIRVAFAWFRTPNPISSVRSNPSPSYLSRGPIPDHPTGDPIAVKCAVMERIVETLSTELPGNKQAPEWILLVPAGDTTTRDGRLIVNREPQNVIAAFTADRKDLPVDYEHATEIRSPKGLSAPAVGWIDQLENREGAIFGRVKWTDEGRRQVENHAYRFISPVLHLGTKRRVNRITSVALTNDPALFLEPLSRRKTAEQQETAMLDKIAKALGLKEDASDAEILSKISETTARVETLRRQADSPDPEKFVARAEHDAMIETCNQLRADIKKKDDAERDRQVADEVEKAITDGKVPPSIKDSEIELCRAIGVDKYRERLSKISPVIETGEGDTKNDPGNAASGTLTDDQKIVCRNMGLSEKEFTETLKAEKAA